MPVKLYGRAADEPHFGAAVRKIPYAVDNPLLEHELQDRSVLWFQLHFGSDALNHRSRDGSFSGRSQDIAIDFQTTIPKLRRAWCEDRFLLEEDQPKLTVQKKGSIQKSRRLKKGIESFAEDRSPCDL